LVLHRIGDHGSPSMRPLSAAHIPGAQYLELPGIDHIPAYGERDMADRVADEIEEFLTGHAAVMSN